MKMLLVSLLCLLTLTTHAQTWPRNPTTHKVEFTGTLPWPKTATTEAQRRALVKRWYLAKLTDASEASKYIIYYKNGDDGDNSGGSLVVCLRSI